MAVISRFQWLGAATVGGLLWPLSGAASLPEAPGGAGTAVVEPLPADDPLEEVIVRGQRPRSATFGNTQPDLSLDAESIRALGVSNIQELMAELVPLTASGRSDGTPVVLLNGQRIASFREIRGYPPEAIERVEVLPENVALRYGYKANQRVVNIVLARSFRSYTSETEYALPGDGAGRRIEQEGGYLRVREENRWSFNAKFESSDPILESDRDLIEDFDEFSLDGNIVGRDEAAEIDPELSERAGEPVIAAAVPAGAREAPPALEDFLPGANRPWTSSQQRYKSLSDERRIVNLDGAYHRAFGARTQGTLNLSVELGDTEAMLGLPELAFRLPAGHPYSPFSQDAVLLRYQDAQGAMRRRSESLDAELGLSLNGHLGAWAWTFTSKARHLKDVTDTDQGLRIESLQAWIDDGDPKFNPYAALPPLDFETEHAVSRTRSGDAQWLLNGSLITLPAGELGSSVMVAYEVADRASTAQGGDADEAYSRSRSIAKAQLTLDLPLLDAAITPVPGTLGATVNVGEDRYRDFGAVRTYGGGLNWSPLERLRLSALWSSEEKAPSIAQLGDPVIATPNRRVYDYVSGETVRVTRTDGGNPLLLAEQRKVFSLGLRADPFEAFDLSLIADYVQSEADDPVSTFPNPTAELEAAFPERFTRSENGSLQVFDNRPINLFRETRRQLSWGFEYTRRLAAPKGGESGPSRDPRAALRRGRGGGGRIRVSLRHTWLLEDLLYLQAGSAPLDYLAGAASGAGGGKSEHELSLRTSAYFRSFGLRLRTEWQSATEVRPAEGSRQEPLRFSDLATVDLRLHYNFNPDSGWAETLPWLRDARVSLSVDNVFNDQQQVHLADGSVPLSHQADALDPFGRTIELEFRKQFR